MTKKRTPKQLSLLSELARMMQDGSVDRTRTLAYLRQKTRADKRGRPPLDKKTGESYQVTIRVTKSMLAHARKQAARAHMTVSEWLRSFIFAELIDGTRPVEDQQSKTVPVTGVAGADTTHTNSQGSNDGKTQAPTGAAGTDTGTAGDR